MYIRMLSFYSTVDQLYLGKDVAVKGVQVISRRTISGHHIHTSISTLGSCHAQLFRILPYYLGKVACSTLMASSLKIISLYLYS